MEEKVEIGKTEYENLRRDTIKLEALEEAGVDNWEWYGEAMTIYHTKLEEAGLD